MKWYGQSLTKNAISIARRTHQAQPNPSRDYERLVAWTSTSYSWRDAKARVATSDALSWMRLERICFPVHVCEDRARRLLRGRKGRI